MGKYWLASAIAMAGLLAVSPLAAQPSPERCALIGPATERLACYDGLFRSGQFTGENDEGTAPQQGMWASGVEVSQIEGTERPFASLQSEQLIPALPRGRQPARMTILCLDESTVVQFAFAGHSLGTPTSHSGTITTQFDRMPSRSQSLQLGADRTTLGFFTDEQALAFLDQLLQADTLFVRAQPQGQRSVTVSFQLEGIEDALVPVREACGW